jgi:hypothetical protein
VVVLNLVGGHDAIDSLPDHGQLGLLDDAGIAPVSEASGRCASPRARELQ